MIMLNNNLRIFITAAETQSLTETARKLYISQPAISQAIKKLEDELNVKLFIRNKRSKLLLTDCGEEILSIAYKMADLENRLYQTAYEENHMMGGTVRIATVPLGASLILSRVLPEFRERYPNVSIELFESDPLEVKNMVRSFKSDLGITTSPYPELEHRTLMKDEIVSISYDAAADIDLREPASDLILCRVAYESVTEQLKGRNIDLSHALIMEAASTQINMIENKNGRGIISKLMLSTIPNDLKCGSVTPRIEMDISLVAHSFSELPTAAGALSDLILNSYRTEPSIDLNP